MPSILFDEFSTKLGQFNGFNRYKVIPSALLTIYQGYNWHEQRAAHAMQNYTYTITDPRAFSCRTKGFSFEIDNAAVASGSHLIQFHCQIAMLPV